MINISEIIETAAAMVERQYVFKASQISKATGLTKRTVQLYTDIGLVVPDIRRPSGKGISRLYSFNNVYEFLMIIKLKESGLKLTTIKKYMDKYRGNPEGLAYAVDKIEEWLWLIENIRI